MEYVYLGNTGLRVSRVCLGMMSFGAIADRPWALGEAGRRRSSGAPSRAAYFFDTADMYYGGASEELTGRLWSAVPVPRRVGGRDQGVHAR